MGVANEKNNPHSEQRGSMASILMASSWGEQEIGGYFELELPRFGDPFPAPFLKYQSARAALRAFLEASDFERVFIPAYICDSVVQAVFDAGRTVEFYRLNDQLLPGPEVNHLPESSFLIYVNYFGLCDQNCRRLERRFSPNQLFIDNTQALFSGVGRALGAIYSPRKFVGLPDGGLLLAREQNLSEPDQEDSTSLKRMDHLLIRASGLVHDGYQSFISASSSLEDTNPLRMSRLTRRLLSSVDFREMKRRRRDNFLRLAGAFDALNCRSWRLLKNTIPLCYPLVISRNVQSFRQKLAAQGIYIPTYWEDARGRTMKFATESVLLDQCLALPCDQRYGEQHIDRIIKIVTATVA